jgi:hypothetical protein
VKALTKSNNPRLWRLLRLDLNVQQIGDDRDTMLHIAARSNQAWNVVEMMNLKMNPFLRNLKNELPIDCATNPEIRRLLQEYAQFQFTRHHAQWYGPYFVSRAYTFLLIVNRWKSTQVRTVARDVCLSILRWLTKYESV